MNPSQNRQGESPLPAPQPGGEPPLPSGEATAGPLGPLLWLLVPFALLLAYAILSR